MAELFLSVNWCSKFKWADLSKFVLNESLIIEQLLLRQCLCLLDVWKLIYIIDILCTDMSVDPNWIMKVCLIVWFGLETIYTWYVQRKTTLFAHPSNAKVIKGALTVHLTLEKTMT